MSTDLGTFEGQQVTKSAIKVTNAGDGLSNALEVDPVIIHHDDEGAMVIRWKCSNVAFPAAGKATADEGCVKRLHTLTATSAAIIDPGLVDELLEAEERRIEELRGIQKLTDQAGADAADGAAPADPF